MTELPRHKQVVKSAGAAAGKIRGINHLVLHTRDMNEGVIFYRDILGLKVVRTQQFSPSAMGSEANQGLTTGNLGTPDLADDTTKQVFFEMASGEFFSLYAPPSVAEHPEASIVPFLWPDSAAEVVPSPQKLDHLAFDVATRDEVIWFRQHLIDNGVPVSELIDRQGTHRFVISIYFSDPSGNPLEIATLDKANPAWAEYDYDTWFRDENPPPALLASSAK